MNKIFGVLLILFVGVFVFSIHAFAQTAQGGNVVILEKDQTITGDYFVGGQTVGIHGTVNGDVYVGGGNVQIDGVVNGDILAAGGTILLQGSARNIRVAGGNITVDTTTEGNVTVVGGNITIARGATIGGSLVMAGGQISVLGPVTKGATLAGGQITVGNSIGSNLLAAGNITLTPEAKVNGPFTYWSNQKATIENGATVSGSITQRIPPQNKQERKSSQQTAAEAASAAAFFSLMSLVTAFILGLLFVKLLPIFMKQSAATILQRPWFSLGIGLITAVATPIVIFLLFVTILGIPLAILLGVAYGIYVYLSKIFVSFAIGMWVFEKNNARRSHPVWAVLVGLIIYEILGLIPFIGWLAKLIFWLMGMGALLITKREAYLTLRSKKLL
jgi:cytoskeletal protein CcmA (bactofilin family)